MSVVVLEQGEDVATRWRSGYDSLRLNTSSHFSHLPDQRFPRRAGRWVSRDDLVAYYRNYAIRHRLRIHTATRAQRIAKGQGGWRVETSDDLYCAAIVVVATGKHHTPVIPRLPGLSRFRGVSIHAAAYRSALPFRDKRVLVVGSGNSGRDISIDLALGGASNVWLSARRPPHIVRREFFGLPHDLLGVAGRRLPNRLLDFSARTLRRFTVGDLSQIGLPIPHDGPVTRLERTGRVPTIDNGDLVRAVSSGAISIVPGIDRFEGGSVLLQGGDSIEADAVIAATGYRSNLEGLVGHLDVLDSSGLPIVHGGSRHPSAPHLYFVGFLDPPSGHLRELRLQAREVARAVRKVRRF